MLLLIFSKLFSKLCHFYRRTKAENVDFWSYRPQEVCIWSKIWRRSCWWRQKLENQPKISRKSRKNRNCFEKNSEKKFSTSKNRMLQIVRNAFSRSFVPIGAKFEGRTDVRSSNFYGRIRSNTVAKKKQEVLRTAVNPGSGLGLTSLLSHCFTLVSIR